MLRRTLEYSKTRLQGLVKIQNKALKIISRSYKTTSPLVLKQELGVPPLDLLLEAVSIKNAAVIAVRQEIRELV